MVPAVNICRHDPPDHARDFYFDQTHDGEKVRIAEVVLICRRIEELISLTSMLKQLRHVCDELIAICASCRSRADVFELIHKSPKKPSSRLYDPCSSVRL